MIEFIVPGNPKSKQRPRFFRGCVYTPKETLQHEKFVAECYLSQTCEKVPYECSIELEIAIYIKPPKTKNKKKIKPEIIEQMLNGEIRPYDSKDLDNIAKLIMDGMNGVAYADDKQVVDLQISKWYSLAPRTEIRMEVIK